MKAIKHIGLSICFIFLMHFQSTAQEGSAKLFKNAVAKNFHVTNKKYRLLQITRTNAPLKFSPFLKPINTKQSAAAQLLSWDMKFKFRLSHNLNIIFSYN